MLSKGMTVKIAQLAGNLITTSTGDTYTLGPMPKEQHATHPGFPGPRVNDILVVENPPETPPRACPTAAGGTPGWIPPGSDSPRSYCAAEILPNVCGRLTRGCHKTLSPPPSQVLIDSDP